MTTRASNSKSVCMLFTGLCVGAIAMYFLDPQTGRRRRALVRDQVTHAKTALIDFQEAKRKDLAYRASGWWSASISTLRSHDDSNEAVNARLRGKLGRLVSHPHAIDTAVVSGHAVLRGRILAAELDRVLDEIARVHGVREVDNQLTAVDQSESLRAPGQGRPSASGYMAEVAD